jgi:hypothetical protein
MTDKIDDQTLEGICANFLRSSLGGPGTDVAAARLRNLDAYNAEPAGDFAPPEVMDRSDFVDTEVADTIDGMLPQLMRIFVASDDAVEFKAKHPDGEALAKTITGYINHLFYTDNDGFLVLYDWFKDALLQKVGHVMVWAEEESEDSQCTYEGLAEEQVAMLLQDGAQLVGEPMQDANGITVTVQYEGKRVRIKIAAVAPHEMRIDGNARWGAEPAAIGRVFLRPRFELDEEGIDTSELPEASWQTQSEAIAELGETSDISTQDIHESHRPVECAELYLKLDRDGDGIAEWLKVGMVGEKIAKKDGKLDIEKVDDHPFCDICPLPKPHAYFGDCPADRAYQPQKQRTNLVRALLDNVYQSVNGRTYVNTNAGVNLDDLLDSRPGGIIRGTGPASDALFPMVQPNLGAPALQLAEFFKQWSENRTGFNRYSAGTDADALNKTKGGMELLTAKADMRTELIARFFALGVRKMFAKMLKLSIKHQDRQEWFQVNGSWVSVNPSEWKNLYNVSINVGLGHGTNDQRLQRLMAMFGMQLQGAQFGVVGPEHIGSTIRQAAMANEFKTPDQFASEKPSGPPVQALQQHLQQMQQQMQQMGQQLQQTQAENQQLKLANANKQGEHELKALELQSKHVIATQPQQPDDNSAEWEKLAIMRFDAITRRMALGLQVSDAEQQFALDWFTAHHDASMDHHGALMDVAAHQQRDDQFMAQQQAPEAE